MSKIYFKFKASLAITLLVLLSVSCKKTEDLPIYGYLSIINASPSTSTYDFYVDDTKANTAALPYGGAIAYKQATVGTYTVKSTIANRSEALLSTKVAVAQNAYYSYYLINRQSSIDALLVADDYAQSSTDKAFVRFINLSPDAPALDLFLTGGSSLVASKAYKTASGFILTAPGTLSFDIKDAAGNVKATLSDNVLVAGYHYTVFAGGFITPGTNEHAINIKVIKHQ